MSFNCSDKETLIAYVYGECDAATRDAVDAHLAVCQSCAGEVGGFSRVRTTLAEWTPPDRVGSFRLVRDEPAEAPQPARVLRPARWWQAPVPALARAAAAILLFAGGAALANLDVKYDKDGFAVRTGWQRAGQAVTRDTRGPVPADTVAGAPALAAPAAPAAPVAGPEAPWRAELAALERQLRQEIRQQTAVVRAGAGGAAAGAIPAGADAVERRILASVQAMIDDSAQRQQLWTAYRLNQALGEVQASLKADGTLPAALPSRARPMDRPLFPVSLKK